MLEAANRAIQADNVEIKKEHIPKDDALHIPKDDALHIPKDDALHIPTESETLLEYNKEEIGHMIEAATVEANICEDAFRATKEQEAANAA
jgi:hypothetical protein